VLADGKQVAGIRELTGGHGAEVILDFVGEGSSLVDGVAMLKRAGSYFLIGYGGQLTVPTIDMIATEINFVGNLVGTYNELVELMTLTRQGKVTLHTRVYPLEAANEAIHDLESGRLRGRAILVP
jgi:NAD+-dependent secondary alcohol dehydrogenase Adh1